MSNKVAEKYKVFQDPELIVVGSMKENTKVGEIDEADVTLLMNRRYDKGFFDFDAKNQEIKLYRRYNTIQSQRNSRRACSVCWWKWSLQYNQVLPYFHTRNAWSAEK